MQQEVRYSLLLRFIWLLTTWSLFYACVSVCLLLLDNVRACSNVACKGDFERLIWSLVKEKISYNLCVLNVPCQTLGSDITAVTCPSDLTVSLCWRS